MITILQIQPGIKLVTGLAVMILFLWILWPGKGGLALIARLRRNNKRALLEDALKFIFDCEYGQDPCDVNSMAGHLNIPMDKAGQLIDRLTAMDLVYMDHQMVALTQAGRSYALRIVRIHRIWERYLADQTSIAPADWHNEALRIQHQVTEEETERLAARMGHPVFDPHGDPIPTAEGDIPSSRGVSLSAMHKGEMGRIIHLEDEPKSIFEQLVVLGLYPGMQVYVTGVTEKKITFVADGEECNLTPLFAGYITVEKQAAAVAQTPKFELLSSLKLGEQAEILGISPQCRGQQRRRLMDLGIVPGSPITAIMRSPSGDPVSYRVMGTNIGIRRQHADQIFINRKS
jgi:DtxR family Mn-dependent transcriptional regulator